jgi:single-stranded DNA-binding protein
MLPSITVIGNLKKMETKHLPSGKQMTRFQIESGEKDKNGNWTNLYLSGEVWEKSSEFVSKYFTNGSAAVVTGKLYTNIYERQDGSKAYENKLLFPQISFIPKEKAEIQQVQQVQQPQVQQQKTIDVTQDEIPF